MLQLRLVSTEVSEMYNFKRVIDELLFHEFLAAALNVTGKKT
jgi:hypothetical protein